MASTLALSPSGQLHLEASASADEKSSAAVEAAWSSEGAGLLHLGWLAPGAGLPRVFSFWRDVARDAVTTFCATPDIEALRDDVELTPEAAKLEAWLSAAPPMTGGEYLTIESLRHAWAETLDALKAEVRASPKQTIEALVASHNPALHVVGKVHFHLAENRRDPAHPFAFLASYTTGLSANGKPQHRPLGEAVRESATARDKESLLKLLVPVKRAAEHSAHLKTLVDSGEIFRPLAWTPRDAHLFLKEVPSLEDSGVVVRVPDWWKARAPPRPQVSISVGQKQPGAVGLGALLDFNVALTMDGQTLTPAELEGLRKSSEGLVLLKGRWVEVDKEKLEQVLAHWQDAQSQSKGGISFIDAMRLLSGAAIGAEAQTEDVRAWSGVQAGPWLAETLQHLRHPAHEKSATLETMLKTTLRPYQREGVEWLRFLSALGLGACLADDMGLGKTVQVLALMLLMDAAKPHLLVVPASLIANWEQEANRFAPSLKVAVAHGASRDVGDARVVITSYGTLMRAPELREKQWGLVVLDEAQAIKNPGAKQTRAVKELKASARVALTGTPVENRVGDLWSIFDFINPGLLGNAKQFTAFVKQSASFAPLRELTRPYLLRRLKTDKTVIADLPEKTELKAWCTLSRAQAALYQQSVDTLARELKSVDGIQRRGLVLSYLVRFKQICNHPSQWLGDGSYDPASSGKHQRLAELCETIAAKQEKVLVFTQFREMTQPLATWLTQLFGRPGLVLSGETAVKKRQDMVKQFQTDEQLPFFVLSLKAGGVGLNLTAASHVIHFDRWWNPAVENQATDRAFRIGQKRNVLVHKLICRGTVEERVDALIESKRSLSAELLEGGNEVKLTELDDNALLQMVSLDLSTARSET